MKKTFTIFLLITVFLSLCVSAFATDSNNPSPKTGYTITFTVEDDNGNAIDDAIITFGEDTYPAGVYSFDVSSATDYGYFVNRYAYVEEAEMSITITGDTEINHVKTPIIELNFADDVMDFSWNQQIGTYNAGIIINAQPYNTDGAFMMLKLYNAADELQIFGDIFEEFSIGGLHYHSGTSMRISADFWGMQYSGNWGTHAISDNAAAGGSLRETALNGAIFYGVMTDGANGTVGIVTPTETGSDSQSVSYIYKDAAPLGDYYITIEAYEPWRPGDVASAGYHSLNDLQNMEPLASIIHNFSILEDPILINSEPVSQTICAEGDATFTVDAESTTAETLTYQWYYNSELMTDSINDNITVSDEGEYYCLLTAGTDELNTATVELTISIPNPELQAIIIACNETTVSLNPGVFAGFEWQDAFDEQIYDVTVDGIYSVTVTDAFGCTATAESDVSFSDEITIDLGDEILLCEGSDVIISAPMSDSYLWNTGEDSQAITTNLNGWYHVTVTQASCTAHDSVFVQIVDLPAEFTLGNDIFACNGSTVTIEGPSESGLIYDWSTDETTQNIDIDIAGTYSLIVTNDNNCTREDEIEVSFDSFIPVNLHTADTLNSCEGLTVVLDPQIGIEWLWDDASSADTLAVTLESWYYVTVTADGGCEGNDSVFVRFYALPDIELGDNQAFCFGLSTDLTAPDAESWLWSTEETTQTITINETGTYHCTITDINACENSDYMSLAIYPLPNVDLGEDITIDNSQTITLGTVPGHTTYDWSTGESTHYILIDGSSLSVGDHAYSVTVTSDNSCVADDEIIITVIEGANIEQELFESLNIYPNPNNGLFNISGETIISIDIYNNIGQLILKTNQQNIDLTTEPAGIYFVKIYTEKLIKTVKVIIQ